MNIPSNIATEAAQRIILLRELTRRTGTVTKRVQTKVLQSLSDGELLQVASILKRYFNAEKEAERRVMAAGIAAAGKVLSGGPSDGPTL